MSARRQGSPPVNGTAPVTLAEHLHVARRRCLIEAAMRHRGYKNLTARQLRISRPHLDKWIALYDIRPYFRTNTRRKAAP